MGSPTALGKVRGKDSRMKTWQEDGEPEVETVRYEELQRSGGGFKQAVGNGRGEMGTRALRGTRSSRTAPREEFFLFTLLGTRPQESHVLNRCNNHSNSSAMTQDSSDTSRRNSA